MLFMGEEYGETAPFLYFVSHGDPGLVEAVRAGPHAPSSPASPGPAKSPTRRPNPPSLRSKLDPSQADQGQGKSSTASIETLIRLCAATIPALAPTTTRTVHSPRRADPTARCCTGTPGGSRPAC